MKTFTEYIEAYAELGLTAIPVNGQKEGIVRWKSYQEQMPLPAERRRMARHPKAEGLAILCGAASGGLEALDFDLKNDLTGALFTDFEKALSAAAPALFDRLVVTATRSGGRHILFRAVNFSKHITLAERPATPEELEVKPQLKVKILIESLGRENMVMSLPSSGYQLIQGDYTSIPFITTEERKIIHDTARSFNRYQKAPKKVTRPAVSHPRSGLTPLEDYNHRADIVQLVEKHGWQQVGEREAKILRFRRPGGSDDDRSANFNTELGLFSTFSPHEVLEARVGYRPANLFAELECNGDLNEAARRLAAAGYGQQNRAFIPKRQPKIITKSTGAPCR